MINIVDTPCNVAGRRIITYEQSGIEALSSFGHATSRRAILPLEEHYHKNCLEIVFLVKGTQVYTVNQQEYSLSGLSGFITYPNEVHGTGEYPQNVSELYWMQIDFSDTTNILGLSCSQSQRLSSLLLALPQRAFQIDNDMISMIADSFDYISSEDEQERCIGTSLIVAVLNKIIFMLSDKKVKIKDKSIVSTQIQNAIDFINLRIEDPLMLEEVAQITGLSLSRFKSKFTEEIGVTPREFINKQKVECAKEMLKNGRSVIDTAMDLSFSSSSYFSVTFKKFTTVTPTEYCKKKIDKSVILINKNIAD